MEQRSAVERRFGRSHRPWAAIAITAALSVGSTVLLSPIWALLGLALGRYDASGRGGPFAACAADSTDCSGPDLVAFGVLALVLLAVAALIALLGTRLQRPRRRAPAFAVHLGVTVAAAVTTAAALWASGSWLR
ncbi:hypothetical protein [Agrococcus jenensis]|uniref:Uncharacterized protein n=1 Tax=Agrococcus jenensis TaxID=46353 RepID=A0A3N2AWM7_9MICO|nr:hypothetical protein [Agrococcus jenensis]ROR67172.1 hypothetical protein EDD26_2577 [Agrococcus jenensis]